MKTIALAGRLGKGRFALVDDRDFERLSKYTWYLYKNQWNEYATRVTYCPGKVRRVAMHRDILKTKLGFIIDHVDNDGLNNQRSNLRYATYSQNSINTRIKRTPTSPFRGVHEDTRLKVRTWTTSIQLNGKATHLGNFRDPHIAALMRDFWSTYLHGAFAKTNFKVISQWTAD